jgi:hypothetical protein
VEDTPKPLVRARHLQQWLALIAATEAPYPERFLQRLAPATRTLITEASPVAWLPAGLHAELAEVMLAAFGARRAHEYYRHAFAASVEGPIFGPLLRAGVAMFGLSPAAFVRWAHKGWQLSFRDAGSLQGEVLEGSRGRIHYRDLPPECAANAAWVESMPSSIYGMLDVTRRTGVVRFIERDPAAGNFTLEIEWS